MIINNAINSPLPTALSLGGTNASLTASNGGIFYSTASAGAILSGTATANQAILSGASTSPSWSTATYPATTTANQLLYSSATNVIDGLSTANSSCLVSDDTLFPSPSSYPVWSLPMQDGQILIGGTAGRPEPYNLTAGENVTIANSSGNITINSTIATRTASSSNSLDFDNVFNSNFIAYRIVLSNIFPQYNASPPQLSLRFATGNPPSYVSSGYIYQIFDVVGNALHTTYPSSISADSVLTTYAANRGVANILRYAGVCGYIDLFVNPSLSQPVSGISRLSYESGNTDVNYANTTSTFQSQPDYYNSVQLFFSFGPIYSGTAYLYGLNY